MAVAFNSFDTLLAPFIKVDELQYKQVKQGMQNFIYSINSNSRAGAEPAFTNITFDLAPPSDMANQKVIVGGEYLDITYGECQEEMNMINRAFCEIMLEGDSEHKLFAYPIPTYNIHSGFDWNDPNHDLIWEMAGKFGTPYFASYVVKMAGCLVQGMLLDLLVWLQSTCRVWDTWRRIVRISSSDLIPSWS